jgi:short-subunit dehydrogenase
MDIQRDESNKTTKTAVEKLGRKATIYTADLSSAEDVAKIVPKVLADGHEIRILVNCAGIQRRHPCEKFPDSDFNEVNIDLLAPSSSHHMTESGTDAARRSSKSTSTPSSASAATPARTCSTCPSRP